MNATIPLALLVLDDDSVTLRPRWFVAAFVGPFQVPLSEIATAYRLRGWLLTSGIGLTTTDEQTAYFWTWQGHDEVLQALAVRGVTIDPTPQPAAAVWRLRSSRPTVTQPATPRPWLVRMLPISLVAATVVAVVWETMPAPLWWRIWIGIVWAIGAIVTFRVWRNSR